MDPGQPKSNAGTIAAILGGIAAVGGIVVAATASSKKQPRLGRAPYQKPRLTKRPCGCGR